MIARVDPRALAQTRLDDAICLHAVGRHHGSVYLCGYAVELILKARICETLGWAGYPDTRAEFADLASFKVHNFGTLLRLTGQENRIKASHLADWSICAQWAPEDRYKVSTAWSEVESEAMIEASKRLMAAL